VTILRLKDGLDYSKLMGEEDQTASTDVTLTHPSTVDLRGLPTSNMMHADSNLSLADLGKTDTVTPKNTISKKSFLELTLSIQCIFRWN
jgi:hypothetical protein